MASSLKDEQDRIRGLLLDTVTLLCRNGLTFKKKLKVQGLLGITLDEENVFIVHFDESLGEVVVDMQDKCSTSTAESDSVRPATANDRTERKSEKKRKATTAELGEPSEKVHIKSEDNDDVVCLEEQPDVKPVPMQALPSYPAEGMYGTYGQLPMSQPPQIMPPVMNANNVSSLPPSVLQTPSSLNTHGLTAYSDGSAITQQMTPEKFTRLFETKMYREKNSAEKSFICNACGLSYYEKHNLSRHIRSKHPEMDPSQLIGKKVSLEGTSEVVVGDHISKFRNKNSENKKHKCLFPDCEKKFYERHNLIRHIKDKHSLVNVADYVGKNEDYVEETDGPEHRDGCTDTSFSLDTSQDYGGKSEEVSQSCRNNDSGVSGVVDRNLLKAFGFIIPDEPQKESTDDSNSADNVQGKTEVVDSAPLFGGTYTAVATDESCVQTHTTADRSFAQTHTNSNSDVSNVQQTTQEDYLAPTSES